MIEITAVGGYSEVGRNMTLVKYKNEAVILDMGVHLERYIKFKGDEELEVFSEKDLVKAKAIPDDSIIKDMKKKVLAIIPSHAHLDHIGAIPYMAKKYGCPIICTPYTAAVINAILEDKGLEIPNEIIILEKGKKKSLSNSIAIELVNITHSIPDAAVIVVHTPEGQVVYTNDFKLDNTPTLGDLPDYKRLKALGKEGHVKALILDSLYADNYRHTPSEATAKEMLRDVMLDVDSSGKAVIVTTFSSHIARLKSIVEFGKKMNRRIVFIGRSLAKYVRAAEKIGIYFSNDVDIIPYKDKIARILKKIEEEGREKYLIVATGHQGEPNAILSRIAEKKFSFKIRPEDHIIFSCTVIPSPLNFSNRGSLESKLLESKARLFKDVHQSGHASREDHRDMIKMLGPENIIPGHADMEKKKHIVSLALEMGYKKKNIKVLEDKDSCSI